MLSSAISFVLFFGASLARAQSPHPLAAAYIGPSSRPTISTPSGFAPGVQPFLQIELMTGERLYITAIADCFENSTENIRANQVPGLSIERVRPGTLESLVLARYEFSNFSYVGSSISYDLVIEGIDAQGQQRNIMIGVNNDAVTSIAVFQNRQIVGISGHAYADAYAPGKYVRFIGPHSAGAAPAVNAPSPTAGLKGVVWDHKLFHLMDRTPTEYGMNDVLFEAIKDARARYKIDLAPIVKTGVEVKNSNLSVVLEPQFQQGRVARPQEKADAILVRISPTDEFRRTRMTAKPQELQLWFKLDGTLLSPCNKPLTP